MKKRSATPRTARTANRCEVILTLVNRQRNRPLDRAQIRRWVQEILGEREQAGALVVQFVSARRSAELNQQFLQHTGPTDIITFDYGSSSTRLCGELFICVAEAVRQAAEFGTTWEDELHRYVIHGLLHLRGWDDLEPEARRRMKREENRLMRRFT